MPDLPHLSIYRQLSAEPKRREEAMTLMPFLLSLEQFITLEDVEYGPEPPDFVFRHAGTRIGVELTDLVPKPFGKGGYARKADFKPWRATAKENPEPRHEFEWGEFTLRESLAAFAKQYDGKIQKVEKWNETFQENWLLMNVGSGGPFGGLVATKRNDTDGRSVVVDDYFAKITHALFSICQRPHSFQQVILFSGRVLLAFPAHGGNSHSFPVPSTDVLVRGAAASDRFLDWRSNQKCIVEHPLLKSELKQGTTPS